MKLDWTETFLVLCAALGSVSGRTGAAACCLLLALLWIVADIRADLRRDHRAAADSRRTR